MLVACPINGPQRQMQLSFLWMNKMCLPATVVARFTSYKSVTLYYSIYEMISPPEITMKITGFGGLNCILLRDFHGFCRDSTVIVGDRCWHEDRSARFRRRRATSAQVGVEENDRLTDVLLGYGSKPNTYHFQGDEHPFTSYFGVH